MLTLSAEPDPRKQIGLFCLRAERDARERRCIGFHGSIENSYSMSEAGAWEATASNGVAGVRRAMPVVQAVRGGIRNCIPLRRREKRVRKDPKLDEKGWEAWTMTARGIINTQPLGVEVFTSRVGPIKPIGRNAIAVGLAEDIVLVQFGNQIHDNDDDHSVAMRRLPHARSAGRYNKSS
jgi:hypothetical protein